MFVLTLSYSALSFWIEQLCVKHLPTALDKPQLQEEKSRRNGDTHHISELQQRLADCTSLDFDLVKGCVHVEDVELTNGETV
ncbi:hypothetical protein T03_15471 [Trichinella britovi]|uniref:Uncharacterized protein n=1 Tax=Trichinella britovi TaxID=45882 RepID=A0A0V1CXJ2_TRIBR|nr:hypothetical protein T03_15471 [Trichinella britovi]